MGVVYSLCMKMVMVELGHALDELPDHKIFIIHDHGNWDTAALQGYNSMVDEPRWQSRDRLVGITPGLWEQAVGLQAADLIAYETFKTLTIGYFERDRKCGMPFAPCFPRSRCLQNILTESR